MDIEKRRADRLRVMRAIFDVANGSEVELVRIAPLQHGLALSEHEIMAACHYLIGERLITAPVKVEGDYIISVQVTHRGIKAAPLARRQRRALPWEARPPHAGPQPRDHQISTADSPRKPLVRS
jgi:hypothetical protein